LICFNKAILYSNLFGALDFFILSLASNFLIKFFLCALLVLGAFCPGSAFARDGFLVLSFIFCVCVRVYPWFN